MIQYKIIKYNNESINSSIIKLYQKIFKIDFSTEFKWWYLENPYGHSYGVVALDNNQVIGHWAVTPLPFSVLGNNIDGLISLAAMVDKKYQGQGIFKEMSHVLTNYLLMNTASKFIIGFPNDNSLFVHINRMGYKHLRDYSFIKFKSNETYSNSYREIKSFVDNINDKIALNKSRFYTAWRFNKKCYTFFENENGIKFVITKFKKDIDILEWSDNATNREISDFANYLYCTQSDVQTVKTWNSRVFKNVESISDRSYHFCIKILDEKDHNTPLVCKKDLWSFHMGDAELF